MDFYYAFHDDNGEVLISVIVAEVRRFSLEWSNQYIIYTPLNGQIGFYSNGENYNMSAGDVIVINPNIPFSTLSDEKGRYCLAAILSPKLFTDYRDDEHTLLFNVSSNDETRNEPHFRQLRSILMRLMIYGKRNSKSDIAFFEGYLHMLVGLLIRKFSYKAMPQITAKQEISGLFTFEAMLSYIEKNFSSNITLEDVARVGNYNPNYVSQFFKFKAGVNFYDYLTRIRLRCAITNINNSDLSFTEIASLCGFPSSKALTRSFIQFYGMSPSDYRTRIRKGDFAQLRATLGYDQERFTSTLARPFSKNIAVPFSDTISKLLESMANDSDFKLNFRTDRAN